MKIPRGWNLICIMITARVSRPLSLTEYQFQKHLVLQNFLGSFKLNLRDISVASRLAMFGLLFGNDKKNRQTFFAACMTKSKAKEKKPVGSKTCCQVNR